MSHAVVVHLSTAPVFTEQAADWPIVSVGPIALAFVARENEGRAVLVIGDGIAEELPWCLPLGEEAATIELFLAYDPVAGTSLVNLAGEQTVFHGAQSAKPVDVALIAGATAEWPQAAFNVLLLADDVAREERRSNSDEQAADRSSSTRKLGTAVKLMAGLSDEADGSSEDSAGLTNRLKPTVISTLEIYTPPSVRKSRVEIVRSVVERSQTAQR